MMLVLVFDPNEPVHTCLLDEIASRLTDGEKLKPIAASSWSPAQPSRLPGSPGDAPITILLTLPPLPLGKLPAVHLVLVEKQAAAYQLLGAASGLGALLRHSPSTRFALVQPMALLAEVPLCVPLMEVGLPSFGRWKSQHKRLLASVADGLLWWLRLCEQQARLVTPSGCSDDCAQILPLRAAPPLQPWHPVATELLRVWFGARLRLQRLGSRSPRHWHIAVGRLSPLGDRLQLQHRLPPDRRGWYADPHLVDDGERCWLFCERFASDLQRGVIDLFALEAGGLRACGTVIEETFHLSFPRVFRHQGQWYATVESAEQREVRLYEAVSFPQRWRLRRLLLEGEAWFDPLLLPMAQGWALLVSRSASLPSQSREVAGELQLFVAQDLLDADFRLHPASPLLLDSLAGRNGGFLELDQQRFRVAQQTGFDGAYGESVQVRRIELLDQLHYRERSSYLGWLPQIRRRLKASHLHTLNSCGPWVAMDYRPR